MSKDRVLLIGIGNRFREDDAIGRRVVSELKTKLPANVQVYENDSDEFTLLEALGSWKDSQDKYGRVILVDAVSSGATTGTVHRLAVHDLKTKTVSSSANPYSSHGFNLTQLIELAETLGKLPSRIIIYGIEAENLGSGTELSDSMANSIEIAAQQILEEVKGEDLCMKAL